jgi:hypothetical protein
MEFTKLASNATIGALNKARPDNDGNKMIAPPVDFTSLFYWLYNFIPGVYYQNENSN